MRDESKGFIMQSGEFSSTFSLPHANRVNASESDRMGQRNSGALGAVVPSFRFRFRLESADTTLLPTLHVL